MRFGTCRSFRLSHYIFYAGANKFVRKKNAHTTGVRQVLRSSLT